MPISLSGGAIVINDDGSASVTGALPDTIWSFPVFKPARLPDVDPDFSEQPNVYVAQFGDGYSQRSPQGLNHIDATMRLTWGMLSYADEDAIRAFFRERGGWKPFWYGLPGDVLWRWRCVAWGGGERFNPFRRINAEFQRVFDPGS
jgi:phage-related protein